MKKLITGWLFVSVLFTGFISELGAVGAQLAVMIFELIFIALALSNSLVRQELLTSSKNLTRNVIFLWMIWIGISSLSVFVRDGIDRGIWAAGNGFEYLVHIVFAYILILCVRDENVISESALAKILWTIPISCLLIAANLLIAWNLYPEIHSNELWVDTPPGYMNIRQGGFHASIGIFVVLNLLLQKELLNQSTKHQTKTFAIYLFSMVLLLAFILWTGGRASVLAFAVAIVAWFFIRKQIYMTNSKLAALLLLVSLGALFVSEMLSVMPWNGINSLWQRSIESENIDSFGSGRTQIWMYSLELIKERPLFGWGTASFAVLAVLPEHAQLAGHYQAHNSVLQFGMDWGLIGLFLATTFLITMFYKGIENYFKYNLRFGDFSILTITSMLFTSLFDGTLYHGQTLFYISIAYALLFSTQKLKNKE